MSEPSGPYIRSVARAVTILDGLQLVGSASVSELARQVGIERTATHRLLRTMERDGLVSGDHGRYQLGPRLLALGNAYLDRLAIRQVALPYALDLRDQFEDRPWVVSLAVPSMDKMIVIDRVWTAKAPLEAILGVGTVLPMASSASGKAVLAYYEPDLAREILGAEVYGSIESDLDVIRTMDGLSFSHGAIKPGSGAVACAVRQADEVPIAAFLISGAGIDDDLAPDSELSRSVARTASAISEAARHLKFPKPTLVPLVRDRSHIPIP